MSKVTVALEALTADSQRWGNTQTALAASGSTCQGLTLTQQQLTWASGTTGLAETYELIRARVELLLTQGADETGKISRTLAHVRRIYESSDQHAIHDLHGVWDIEK